MIHYAVRYGDLGIVRDVLRFPSEKVGNLRSVGDDWTPLHYAVYYDGKGLISFLIDQGASIEAGTTYGRKTPLHIAIEANRFDIFALLISKGANIHAWDSWERQTPIQKARSSGRLNMVDLLNYVTSNNSTPLHYAVQEGRFKLAVFLLDNDVNIEVKDKSGKTPLDLAAELNQPELANLLRAKQSEKSVQRRRRHHHGDNPRHYDRSSRKLLATDLSNQSEIVTNSSRQDVLRDSLQNDEIGYTKGEATSGSKPSSWVNAFAKTVDAVKSVSQFISSPFKPAIDMEHSQPSKALVTQGTDVNSTLFLLDVFIRKITGQKYISTVDQHVSSLEAQGYALSITDRFKKAVEQAAKESKVSMHQLGIDFVKIQGEVTKKTISGKFDEISGVLNSYVEKACPNREAGCPGKLSSKKFNKFMVEFNKGLLNQPMQRVLSRNSTLEASNVKEQQISLEPRSYLNDTSIQGHLIQARDLGLR